MRSTSRIAATATAVLITAATAGLAGAAVTGSPHHRSAAPPQHGTWIGTAWHGAGHHGTGQHGAGQGWTPPARQGPGGPSTSAGTPDTAAPGTPAPGIAAPRTSAPAAPAAVITLPTAPSSSSPATPASVSTAATTPPATPMTTAAPPPSITGKHLTWSDEFSGPIAWGSHWVGNRSTAYRYGDHNPDDNKLDWLSTSAVTVANGAATFTATPSSRTLENGKRAWTTGLLTTEGSTEGFRVKAGDYIETRVTMPAGIGAWPALWTWRDGGNEIDSFEYHPDNPNLLELNNHVRSGSKNHTDAAAISPGEWVTIGTHYGADSVDWYVNGAKVYSDGSGVGSSWSAYPILNLSLCAGAYHPAPQGTAPISFAADYLRVWR